MATRLARYAITVAGMSKKIGLMSVNQVMPFGHKTALENASQKTAEAVDGEVRLWTDAAYANAGKIIAKNKAVVKKLAEALLKHETLDRVQIEKIVLKK
jgi:cell division protease FtsH